MKPTGILAAAAIALGLAAPASAAGDWPEQGVRWVIPFGAGGGTDNLARQFTAAASRIWGQSVTVENRPGAGAVAGWEHILGEAADGYTIFNASPTPMITLLSEDNAPIQPTDISILGYLTTYSAIVIGGDEIGNWDKFTKVAGERPVTVGGTNSIVLGAAFVLDQAGVDVIYVPYGSTGEAVTDFLGGHIDAVVVTENTAMKIAPEKGNVVFNGSSRPLLPDVVEALGGDVTNAGDLGFDGMAFPRWVGVHPDTPEEIQAQIADRLAEVAADPELQAAFRAAGSPIDFIDRAEASADYLKLIERMRVALPLLD